MLEHLEINAQKRKNMQQNSRLSEGTKNKMLNRIVEEAPVSGEDFSDL